MKKGMVIDLQRCVGCDACTVACKQANGTPPAMFYTYVSHEEKGSYPKAYTENTPRLCMHCENAPCVDICPTGASKKNADGTVTIDKNLCDGCESCMEACPYGARTPLYEIEPYFQESGLTTQEKGMYSRFDTGKVYKCDFCTSRGAEKPKCVETCPADARVFGDLDDKKSEVAMLIKENKGYVLDPEFGTKPQVYYIQKRKVKK